MSDAMMFDHHKRIIEILSRMDPAVLKKAECYFGGGTAISLLLNEYRESVDIDFLCSSDNGYRFLRETLWDKGIGSLCYQDQWNLFDQQILSYGLLGKDYSTLKFWKNQIFRRDYLFQTEGKYKGTPKRTSAGGVWLDGYSDHLPVVVYLLKEKQ